MTMPSIAIHTDLPMAPPSRQCSIHLVRGAGRAIGRCLAKKEGRTSGRPSIRPFLEPYTFGGGGMCPCFWRISTSARA